jgi:hypothetical protein
MPATLDPTELDLDVRQPPPGRPRALLPLNHLHLGRLTLVVVALGIVWRVIHYLLAFPIWGDEGFVAINFLVRDAAGMLQPLKWGQIVSAGYMWIGLAACRWLGTSEWALRFPSFVFGIASLLIFYRFAWRVLPLPAAALATSILAIAYYPIRHATEVKPYALDMLVSLGLTVLAWAVFQRPQSAWRWLALIGLGAAAPWLSYPAAFVAGGAGILLTILLVRRRFDRSIGLGWAVFGLLLVASFVAMYSTYGRAQAEFGSRLVEIDMWRKAFPPSLAHPLEFIGWMLWMHTGNMLAYPFGSDKGGSTATFLLVCVGAVRMWRQNRSLLVLLLSPLALAFIAGALQRYPYGASARTSLFMAPAFCLLAGVGLWRVIACCARGAFALRSLRIGARQIWIEWGRGPLLRLAVCVFLLTGVGGSIYSIKERGEDSPEQRSRDAVTAVRNRTLPGDRWVIFNAVEPVPYAPYLGDWKGTGGQFVFDVARFAPEALTWAPPPEAVPKSGRVWLMAYRGVKVEFPESQFAAYRDALTARLGSPSAETYWIKERDGRTEAIELLAYPNAGTPGQ